LSSLGTFGDKNDNYVHIADTLSIEWKLKEFKRQTKSIVEREQEIEEEKRTFTASTILEKSCLSSFFTDVKQSVVAVLLCTICISGKTHQGQKLHSAQ
jgi:hypothetical protein